MNNWVIEISPFKITFEYIKGIKNTLADTMSRFIKIDPIITPKSEPEGYEFGYYVFDPLSSLNVEEIDKQMNETQVKLVDDENTTEMKGLPHDKLVQLQGQGEQCAKLIKLLKDNKMSPRKPYFLEKDVLCKIEKMLLTMK